MISRVLWVCKSDKQSMISWFCYVIIILLFSVLFILNVTVFNRNQLIKTEIRSQIVVVTSNYSTPCQSKSIIHNSNVLGKLEYKFFSSPNSYGILLSKGYNNHFEVYKFKNNIRRLLSIRLRLYTIIVYIYIWF